MKHSNRGILRLIVIIKQAMPRIVSWVVIPVVYALLVRALFGGHLWPKNYAVMSMSFLFFMPVVVGALTVYLLPEKKPGNILKDYLRLVAHPDLHGAYADAFTGRKGLLDDVAACILTVRLYWRRYWRLFQRKRRITKPIFP